LLGAVARASQLWLQRLPLTQWLVNGDSWAHAKPRIE
jgi:hypothetical protein